MTAIVPDTTYAGMYRVSLPDGSLSDMASLTRANASIAARAASASPAKVRPRTAASKAGKSRHEPPGGAR
jgi:hypothetical protein